MLSLSDESLGEMSQKPSSPPSFSESIGQHPDSYLTFTVPELIQSYLSVDGLFLVKHLLKPKRSNKWVVVNHKV